MSCQLLQLFFFTINTVHLEMPNSFRVSSETTLTVFMSVSTLFTYCYKVLFLLILLIILLLLFVLLLIIIIVVVNFILLLLLLIKEFTLLYFLHWEVSIGFI